MDSAPTARPLEVLLVAHGYPPEQQGGTERSVQRLAAGLYAAGVSVTVLAGSLDWSGGTRLSEPDDPDPAGPRVLRLHRGDAFFDHWHKSRSPEARAIFARVLEDVRPDVVHVHHWVRLSRDLVATAARAGIPAVVSLHDFWTTCPIAFRVRPQTGEFCEAPMAPDPCLACAGSLPPHTPWVDAMAGRVRLAEHARDLAAELDLAAARIVPSLAHGRALERFGGRPEGASEFTVVPPGIEAALGRRPAAPPPPGSGQALGLAFWGHLSPVKGLGLIPRALRLLAERGRLALADGAPALRVEILGGDVDPDFGARLRAECDGLPVRFHGAFESGELAGHPALSDVHAMLSPSLAHESYGMVIDEALSLGLPCVLSDGGAYAERCRDADWALLFERGSEVALADALERLLTEPEALRTMTAALPAEPLADRTWARHAARTLEVYARAIASRAPDVAPLEWFADRIQAQQNADWERELGRATPQELGFE